MMPDINARCWRESKKMAMRKEARMQCGSIRIQTDCRRNVKRARYLELRKSTIRLQAWAREQVYRRTYNARMDRILFDRAVRKRHTAVKMIARAFKAHVVHEIYMENLRRKIAEKRR